MIVHTYQNAADQIIHLTQHQAAGLGRRHIRNSRGVFSSELHSAHEGIPTFDHDAWWKLIHDRDDHYSITGPRAKCRLTLRDKTYTGRRVDLCGECEPHPADADVTGIVNEERRRHGAEPFGELPQAEQRAALERAAKRLRGLGWIVVVD